jgi:hypothetical protein
VLRGVRRSNRDNLDWRGDGLLRTGKRWRGDRSGSGESIGGAELEDMVWIRGGGRLREAGQRARDDPVSVSGAVASVVQDQGLTAYARTYEDLMVVVEGSYESGQAQADGGINHQVEREHPPASH